MAAGNNCLFDYSLRLNNPSRYAALVATLFQGVGLGQPDFAPEAHAPAVKLMLRLLDDMKAMSMYWQRNNLEAVFRRMIQEENSIKVLLQEVSAQPALVAQAPKQRSAGSAYEQAAMLPCTDVVLVLIGLHCMSE